MSDAVAREQPPAELKSSSKEPPSQEAATPQKPAMNGDVEKSEDVPVEGVTSTAPKASNDDSEVIEDAPSDRLNGGENGADENDSENYSFLSQRKSRQPTEPAIVFRDSDGMVSIKKIVELVNDRLGPEDNQSLIDLQEYIATDNGAWALGSPHLTLLGRLLNDKNFPPDIPIQTLKLLQAIAFKDDIILLLHQDRKDHNLMAYMYRIEQHTQEEQEEIAKLLCNLCFNTSSFDWLMYISEWQENGQMCNNSKVTVRAAVHSILSDKPVLQEKGSVLMYNLALKELFDDTATELATAVLQYLHGNVPEEAAFQCLSALLRFLYISYNDVPALVKMLGPDLQKFHGMSERVDQLAEQIQFKLSVTISA